MSQRVSSAVQNGAGGCAVLFDYGAGQGLRVGFLLLIGSRESASISLCIL